jgi:hypothetical protein
MIRRSSATIHGLLGIAVLATLLAGCGAAKTTAPARSAVPSATPSSSAVPSATASSTVAISGSPAPSATLEPTFPLPHADAALEDKLPSTIDGVALLKTSLTLSGYIATPPAGGEKALYPAWLVKFGKIPSDVKIAIAVLVSDQVIFKTRAIEVPGIAASTLSSSFADLARKAGWTVVSHTNYLPGKSILDMTNPASSQSLIVYANGDVMYEIVTDDQNLVNEALILLP